MARIRFNSGSGQFAIGLGTREVNVVPAAAAATAAQVVYIQACHDAKSPGGAWVQCLNLFLSWSNRGMPWCQQEDKHQPDWQIRQGAAVPYMSAAGAIKVGEGS